MIVGLLVCNSATAGFVVQNHSFESPDLPVNYDINNPGPFDGFSIETPSDWTWNSFGIRGVAREGIADLPAGTDGDQWGFLRKNAALSQLVGPRMLQANTAYDFSFFQFEQTNIFDSGGGLQFEIWGSDPFSSGSSALDSIVFAPTGSGNMVQRTGSLNSGTTAISGGDLYIVLRAIPDPTNSNNMQNVVFDEIVLTQAQTAVPEPSSFLLMGIGGIALIVYGRRWRRHMHNSNL